MTIVEPSGQAVSSPKIRDQSATLAWFIVSLSTSTTITPWITSRSTHPKSIVWRELMTSFAMGFIAIAVVAVPNGIKRVFAWGSIGQIFRSVVKAVAIQVSHLQPVRSGAILKKGHQFMDVDSLCSPIDIDDNTEIARAFSPHAQCLFVPTLSFDAGDDLMGTWVELVSRSPRDGQKSFVMAIKRSLHSTRSHHDLILAGAQ